MAGNNNFTHLPLPFIFRGKPKLRGGNLPSEQTIKNRTNRVAHGGYVKRRAAELLSLIHILHIFSWKKIVTM